MQAAFAVLVVVVATASAQVNVQQCSDTELVFLLDHSENAKKASTEANGPDFQLLINAWQNHMDDLARLGNDKFKIWPIAYSGTAKELMSRGSSPTAARNAPIGSLEPGGSWTYQGLEMLKNASPSANRNNLVIIISAQGTFDPSKRRLATAAYNNMKSKGWNTRVIGVKSSRIIDVVELNSVNDNGNATILDDGKLTNKKSYTLLPPVLKAIVDNELCTRVPITPPVATLTPCSSCKIEAGVGYDRHAVFCDSYYQCNLNGNATLMHCGQRTFWDSDKLTCVAANDFKCPTGTCTAGMTATYPSGGCCNMFYSCVNGVLTQKMCDPGQVYNQAIGGCRVSQNADLECKSKGSFYCNGALVPQVFTCEGYAPDPYGDPCKFQHGTAWKRVPAGSVWDQSICGLRDAGINSCTSGIINRGLAMSANCAAVLLATFTNEPYVQTPRDAQMKLVMSTYNISIVRGSLLFSTRNKNIAYFYYFSNNAIPRNSAFKIVFQLDNNVQTNVDYVLFSNAYCSLCEETLGAYIRKTGSSNYVITTKFLNMKTNSFVSTTTTVNVARGGWIDLRVIWGDTVHGTVKVLDSRKRQVSEFPLATSTVGGGAGFITSNKCGIVLGSGAGTQFIGLINEFAYYTNCTTIDTVLTA